MPSKHPFSQVWWGLTNPNRKITMKIFVFEELSDPSE